MHGDALSLADQVFLFKRTVREAAASHVRDVHGQADGRRTEPAMHVHQSIVDEETGQNLFTSPETGGATSMFYNFSRGCRSTRRR